MSALHHTNIVPVFGVGEHDGLPYYAMQFIQGMGLDKVIEELTRMQSGSDRAPTGPLTKPETPASRGDVAVVGVARSLLSGRFQCAETRDESAQAFEQRPDAARAAGDADPAAVGALGASPSHSDAGRLSDSFPISSSTLSLPGSETGGPNAHAKQPTYWQSVAGIGPKAIERDPGRRYASAAEFQADLQRYIADEPIKARRISSFERHLRGGAAPCPDIGRPSSNVTGARR